MAGVYLSYPFCAQKCTYCNFASGIFPASVENRYLEALARELQAHRWEWAPETVYLGGGTPSAMGLEQFSHLLELVPGTPWVEATIEAAPGTVTPERARAWKQCGITRVSLGVQSFVETEIRRTGRKHSAETVEREIETLRELGIDNLNIDLIAGLPGQTAASWSQSVDWVVRIEPPHVSVYMLEIDEDSRLGKEILLGGRRYGAADRPGEEETAAFYETAVKRLAAAGLQRYEISNFARPGYESRHNLKYWRLEPYAGFGADAHSFDGCDRKQNPESVREYLEGHAPDATPARLDEERFFVGLRLSEGITPEPEEWLRFETAIRRFLDEGLLETAGARLRLTDRGVMLSNEVFQEFLLS
ncbi:MAG TPA: radical SAM family heme chaperone HemW [Bryobacteraceae bacterium]